MNKKEKINISNIKIFIETNIPSGKTNGKNETDSKVLFSKEMLYIPKIPNNSNEETDVVSDDESDNKSDNKSDDESDNDINKQYPLFTSQYKFPKDILIRRSYQDKINFFFNKKIFVETLEKHGNRINDNSEEIDNIMQYNLNTMIELLFTTVYPVINNNTESISNFEKNPGASNFSFKGTIPNFLQKMVPSLSVDYTYLKLKDKIYTVTSTCILNDFINHPEYRKLINSFSKYKNWKLYENKIIAEKTHKNDKEISDFIVNNKYFYSFPPDFNRGGATTPIATSVPIVAQSVAATTPTTAIPIPPELSFLPEVEYLPSKMRPKLNYSENAERYLKKNSAILNQIRKRGESNNISEKENNYSIELSKLFISFIDEIKSKKGNNDIQKKEKVIFDLLNEIKNKIYDANTFSSNRYDFNSNDKNYFFKDISTLVNKSITLHSVYNTHFIQNSLIFISSSEKKNVEAYFTNEYKNKVDFLKVIKQFIKPYRQTLNKGIQMIINENSSNTRLINTYLEYVKGEFIEHEKSEFTNELKKIFPEQSNVIYIGVNIYDQHPKFEAYVYFNLIGGELNTTNVNQITCNYRNKQLGRLYSTNKKDKFLITKNKYDDLKSMLNNVTKTKPINIKGIKESKGGSKNNYKKTKKIDKKKKTINKTKRLTRKFKH
jgi:hypothetical protein